MTGVGLVTALGLSAGDTFAATLEGRSGLGPMPDLEQPPSPDKGGGQALSLPAAYSPSFSRAARYLRFAVEQALIQAGPARTTAIRVGAVVGTTLHGMRAGGKFLRRGDPRLLSEFLAGSVLMSALGGLGVEGPRLTTCSACSSGLGSVMLGVTLLRAGVVDRVIVGGYDTVSEYAYAGFDSLRLIADGPPRPFGADREGMKVAEGYGVLVLERAPDAAARGAPLLAIVAGCGESSDSYHLTQPRPDGGGAARAIRRALEESDTEAIDLISAHATATRDNDAAEYAALSAVFGPSLRRIPVVAFKGHLGHTLGGAGAVELVLTIQAMTAGRVPPTLNTGETDAAFVDLQLVRGAPKQSSIHSTANLSLGFGGANSCVVLRQPRGAVAGRSSGLEREVVITGVGLVLPGASTMDELKTLIECGGSLTADAGRIPEESYISVLNARRVRRLSDYSKLSLAAATRACTDAGVLGAASFLSDCAAILGTTHGASPFCEAFYGQVVREGLAAANPVLFAEGVPNAAAAHLSMALGIQGPCQIIIGTRTAGLEALLLAVLRIRHGEWSRAIVSAAEEYSPVVNSAYAACGLRGGADGLFTGSGAVALVVEEARAAALRGAHVWAEVGSGAWGEPPPDAGSLPAWGAHSDVLVRAVARSNAHESRVERSVYGVLPELFSAGPLAALAAGIVAEAAGSFVTYGAGLDGSRVSLVINRRERRGQASMTPTH